jgi:uncharacterized LabA/DUF88 family protein
MSIIKQKKQRVAIFIDAQNLYHSARGLYGANVNFKNILEDTLADRELVRAIAYVIATEGGDEKNFFEALKKAGIETKSKDLQIFIGGAKKGDWDVGMAVDAIRVANKVDTIIIISGDGDFIPLVEYLKFNAGCQVEAATFKSSAAAGFIEVVDDFLDLSEDPERYLMRSFKQGRHRSFSNKFVQNKIDTKIEKGEENLERETPEMIAERVSGKRGVIKKPFSPIKKITDKSIEKVEELKQAKQEKQIKQPFQEKPKALKATEVKISRVKKEDFIKESNLENKKKQKNSKSISIIKTEKKVIQKNPVKKTETVIKKIRKVQLKNNKEII